MLRFLRPLLLVFSSLFLLFLASQSTTSAQSSGYWSQLNVVFPTEYNLNGVYMVDGSNGAWIVSDDGNSGQISRLSREGENWQAYTHSGFRAPLRSVVAIAADNVWAVGDKGLIVHNEDNTWREFASPVPDADLSSIQMFGNGETGLIAGTQHSQGQRVLLRFADGEWQRDLGISGPGDLLDLHFATGVGYAVAKELAWRYSGGRWQPEEVPCNRVRFFCATNLSAVRGVSDDEAWAVGLIEYGVPSSLAAIHRVNGLWKNSLVSLPDGSPADWNPLRTGLSDVSFSDAEHGIAVGFQLPFLGAPIYPLVISYRPDGLWHYEPLPYEPGKVLKAVSHADANHAIAVGTGGMVLGYGYSSEPPAPTPTLTPDDTPGPTPTAAPVSPLDPAPRLNTPEVFYFNETGHNLQGGFRVYWEEHGGLQQFGYPITEELDQPYNDVGSTYKVQYFERAKFEYHPENRPPYDILLSLLGRQLTAARAGEPVFQPAQDSRVAGGRYFPETSHNMAPEFVAYWDRTGGLPVYGYPISEPFEEKSATDGSTYLVQYFERNRLEYHPGYEEHYRVSLGLLGVELAKRNGW